MGIFHILRCRDVQIVLYCRQKLSVKCFFQYDAKENCFSFEYKDKVINRFSVQTLKYNHLF